MSGEITVTVPKWDYFQPKSIRERNPYWFRINKDMTNSSGLVGLSPAQKWAWVCLLGLCCSQDSKTIKFRTNRLACIANVDEKSILEMLEILKENHTIEFKTESTTFKTESTTPTIQNNTIQNNTNYIGQNKFDLEGLYFLYPRKVKKKKGIEKLRVLIKTQETFEAVKKSILNYSDYCSKNITESRYIMHFSTFVSSWEDYLEPIIEFKKTSKTDIGAILRGDV